jgi:MerR family copper efflux transcriptional regulator
MAMRALTIGTAAREAGAGVETIRFYERQKLIERPPKPVGAGVRRYPSETIARIRFIREAQQLGFSLREIRELLALRADPAADCSKVREQALAKLHEVHDKIERLRQIGSALETLITACPAQGSLQACSITDALELRSGGAVEFRESSTKQRRHHTED